MKIASLILLILISAACSHVDTKRTIASERTDNAEKMALDKLKRDISKQKSDLKLAKLNIAGLLAIMEDENKKARTRFYKSVVIDGALGLNLAFYGAISSFIGVTLRNDVPLLAAAAVPTAVGLGYGSYKFYQRIQMNYKVAKEYSKALEEFLSKIKESNILNDTIIDEDLLSFYKLSYSKLLLESESLKAQLKHKDKGSFIFVPVGIVAGYAAVWFRRFITAVGGKPTAISDRLFAIGLDVSIVGLIVAPLKLILDNAEGKFQLNIKTIKRFKSFFKGSLEKIGKIEERLIQLEQQIDSYYD